MKTYFLLFITAIVFFVSGFSLHKVIQQKQDYSMKRVTSIGGVFFKCKDPEKIKEWYSKHLGIKSDKYGSTFEWRHSDDENKKGFTAWAPFSQNTKYFNPSEKEFMINYRVENLEQLVQVLKEEGVTVVDEIEVYEYGKFVHIMDIEGNKIELWEPNDEVYDDMLEIRIK